MNAQLFGFEGTLVQLTTRTRATSDDLDKRVNGESGIAARLNARLNGKGGVSSTFDQAMKATTSQAIESINKMTEVANGVTEVLGQVKTMAVLGVGLFIVGTAFGVVLVKFVA
jgi:hypothetical protein